MSVKVINRPVRVQVKATPKPIRVNAATAKQVQAVQQRTNVQVSDGQRDVVVKDPVTTIIDAGGKQGVKGPQGPVGPAGGADIYKVAATSLGGSRVVRSTGNDLAGYADCSDPNHGDDVLGITRDAVSAGVSVRIASGTEVVEPSWNWIPQQPIYLAEDGLMTQIPPDPADGAAFSLEVGMSTDTDSMLVRIGTPVYF